MVAPFHLERKQHLQIWWNLFRNFLECVYTCSHSWPCTVYATQFFIETKPAFMHWFMAQMSRYHCLIAWYMLHAMTRWWWSIKAWGEMLSGHVLLLGIPENGLINVSIFRVEGKRDKRHLPSNFWWIFQRLMWAMWDGGVQNQLRSLIISTIITIFSLSSLLHTKSYPTSSLSFLCFRFLMCLPAMIF